MSLKIVHFPTQFTTMKKSSQIKLFLAPFSVLKVKGQWCNVVASTVWLDQLTLGNSYLGTT